MSVNVTDRLSEALRAALSGAGLDAPGEILWEVPREEAHGDYATNAAMLLAKSARRPPRQVAEAIRQHFPRVPEVEKVEVAGPGFVNVFLAPAWSSSSSSRPIPPGPWSWSTRARRRSATRWPGSSPPRVTGSSASTT